MTDRTRFTDGVVVAGVALIPSILSSAASLVLGVVTTPLTKGALLVVVVGFWVVCAALGVVADVSGGVDLVVDEVVPVDVVAGSAVVGSGFCVLVVGFVGLLSLGGFIVVAPMSSSPFMGSSSLVGLIPSILSSSASLVLGVVTTPLTKGALVVVVVGFSVVCARVGVVGDVSGGVVFVADEVVPVDVVSSSTLVGSGFCVVVVGFVDSSGTLGLASSASLIWSLTALVLDSTDSRARVVAVGGITAATIDEVLVVPAFGTVVVTIDKVLFVVGFVTVAGTTAKVGMIGGTTAVAIVGTTDKVLVVPGIVIVVVTIDEVLFKTVFVTVAGTSAKVVVVGGTIVVTIVGTIDKVLIVPAFVTVEVTIDQVLFVVGFVTVAGTTAKVVMTVVAIVGTIDKVLIIPAFVTVAGTIDKVLAVVPAMADRKASGSAGSSVTRLEVALFDIVPA